MDLSEPSDARNFLERPHNDTQPSLSPDGRWLAYVSEQTGIPEVYVRPFPEGTDGIWAISNGGGTQPIWASSGREIFYLDDERNLVSALVRTAPTFALEETTVLFLAGLFADGRTTRWTNPYSHWYDVSPDDQRFLFLRPVEPQNLSSSNLALILVENWFSELEGRF